MQTANCYVYLGNDKGTSVPKENVTAAEIAILRAIHGPDAVHEIEPIGQVERTHREERQRLVELYGRSTVDDDTGRAISVVQSLFPGAASRVFTSLDELDIPEVCFKAEKRVTAKNGKKAKAAAEPETDEPELFG